MNVVISSGHAKYVQGAIGPKPWGLNEVDEARRVVEAVAAWLARRGIDVAVFHDDVSTTQSENLNRIVSAHNANAAADRLDVSVHFNAYVETSGGRGTEVLYISREDLALKVAGAIAGASGLINRGAHLRSDLYFLNGTTGELGAVLIEVCFVDAAADVEAYGKFFDPICEAIAAALSGEDEDEEVAEAEIVRTIGKVSWFGGPDDMGVSPSEGLAFLFDVEDKPEIFAAEQPPGTTGLARRLDADNAFYVAMRWDYDQFPKDQLAGYDMALVRSPKTGKEVLCHPADWGPHTSTNRVADVSPATLRALEIETDDEVEVIYPAARRAA